MFGYWIKKRSVFSLIVCAAIAVVYMIVCVSSFVINESDNQLKKSVYEKCSISYDIPSPTKSQLLDIRSMAFVDDVFGYYLTDATLNHDGDSMKVKLMISDCVDAIEITMFNDSRIIDEANDSYECPLYIGSDFATENNLNIGDELLYDGYTLTVAAIFEPDTYKNCVLVPVESGSFLEMIEGKVTSYSGAYIDVNDEQAAESFLRTYKPEGRLRDRSVFETDEEYRIHYDSWSNASYYNEVTSFSENYNSLRLADTSGIWIGSAALIGVYIIICIILFIRKSERVYFKTRKSKIGLKGYYVLTMLFDASVMAGASILSSYICGMSITEYILPSVIAKSEIIVIVALGISVITGLMINLIMLGSATKARLTN